MSFSLGRNFKNRSNPRERERATLDSPRRESRFSSSSSLRARERKTEAKNAASKPIHRLCDVCVFAHPNHRIRIFFQNKKRSRILQSGGEEFHSFVSLSFSSTVERDEQHRTTQKRQHARKRKRERETYQNSKRRRTFWYLRKIFLREKKRSRK